MTPARESRRCRAPLSPERSVAVPDWKRWSIPPARGPHGRSFFDSALGAEDEVVAMSAPAAATAASSALPAASSATKNLAKNPRLPFAPRVNGKRFVVQRSVSKFKTNFAKVPARYTLKFVKLLAEELNARLARIEAGPGLQRVLKKLVQNKCLTNVMPHRPAASSSTSAPSVAVSVDPHGQTPVAPAIKTAAVAARK